MTTIERREDEPFESMIRRFKAAVDKSRVLREWKRRQSALSRNERARLKRKAALNRRARARRIGLRRKQAELD